MAVTLPLNFMVLLFVVSVVVVVSFFSGVVVVVVIFCSGAPAGVWANAPVTKATPINTVSAIISAFFIFFPLLEFLVLRLIQEI
jgi:hypothetical protein